MGASPVFGQPEPAPTEPAPPPAVPADQPTPPAPVPPADTTEPPPEGAPPLTPAAPAPAPVPTEPEAPAGPPPRTGISGVVTDTATGAPLARVEVTVVSGGSGKATTDAQGRYTIELTPGTYTIRLQSETHAPKRVRVIVRGGRRGLLDLDVDLDPSEEAVEVIYIEAAAETKTEAGSLQVRRKATTVSDSMSAQEMSRTADSSAAGAVKRVVSATVIDGKYVLVRGLGGRYMTTLLNGVTLPSPEPDKQAVPLDLFPTSLLANLTVAKSYAPRAPGTFAGGTLMIETNSYPSDFTLKLKASTSVETGTTLSDRRTYSGGGIDYLGFDDGTRSLPGSVPSTGPLRIGTDGMVAADIERVAEDFDNNWTLGTSSTPPNLSLGVTVGDTTRLEGRKLGYIATASFSRGLDVRETTSSKVTNSGAPGEGLAYNEQITTIRGETEATLGGLVNVGYELDNNHELGVFWLYTHTGESQASILEGTRATDVEASRATHLEWSERFLNFVQISGRHRSPSLSGLVTRWQTNFALTGRDEPDTRDILYTLLEDGRERFKNEPGSGERFFSTLSETSVGAGLDVELPTRLITYRTGATAQQSERDFSARRFRMNFVGSDVQALFAGPDQIFNADAIGPQFQMTERTLITDAYAASLLVAGVYGELEVEATKRLRLIGGVRYELSQQELTPGSPFGLGVLTEDDNTKRDDGDFLPAISTVYALTPAMNLRTAYSYTLARPRFRELAPFLYVDYDRRRIVSGNPTLVTTRIHNGDVRWEWFARDTEVYAASVFYKQFVNPTEQVVVSAQSGDVSFANAAGATVYGVEFEARLGLERLLAALDGFRAQANVSLIRSQVELEPEQLLSQTSLERPLQGQSPYVVNAGVGYSNAGLGLELNAFYNVFGRRIDEVGFDTLPDVYEQPFHRVDVTASKKLARQWSLKVAGKNLLNRSVSLDQGNLEIYQYRPGVGLSASLEWAP
jgi:hypothetical protein